MTSPLVMSHPADRAQSTPGPRPQLPKQLVVPPGAIPELLQSFESIEEACRNGLRSVRFEKPIHLNHDEVGDVQAMAALRLLRDLTSCALEVDYELASPPVLAPHHVAHIVPPRDACEHSRVWREQYRFGKLYWRNGPDFISIRDIRGESLKLFILDDDASRDVFVAHLPGTSFDLHSASAETIELSEEGLLAVFGTQALTLPYRMRHWPIPFRAV